MKLEVGKTYRNRAGVLVEIIKRHEGATPGQFCYTGRTADCSATSVWFEDGRYTLCGPSQADLIIEVVAPKPGKTRDEELAELIRAALDGATIQRLGTDGMPLVQYATFTGLEAVQRIVHEPRERWGIKPAPVSIDAARIALLRIEHGLAEHCDPAFQSDAQLIRNFIEERA